MMAVMGDAHEAVPLEVTVASREGDFYVAHDARGREERIISKEELETGTG